MPTPRKKTPEELLLEQQAGMSRPGPGDEPAGSMRPAGAYAPAPGSLYLGDATAGAAKGRRMEGVGMPDGRVEWAKPGAAKPGPASVLDAMPMPRPAQADPTAALLAANQPEAKAGPTSVLDVRPQWGQMTNMGGRDYAYTTDKTGFKTDLVPADQLTPEAVTRLQWRQAYNDRLPGLGAKIPAGFNATQGDIWQAQQDNLNLGNAAAGADAFMRQSIAAQKADADRALAASQFDQNQTLAQADLAARRDQENQRLAQQRQEMLLRLDPSVIRGQALTNAAVAAASNPQFDMKAFMANLGDATAANKDAYNRVAGGLGLPATPAAAQAGPGPDYLDSKKKAETVLNNVLGQLGEVATGPDGTVRYKASPDKLTPDAINKAAASLAGFDLDPEAAQLVQERLRQVAGPDAQKIRDALMQQLATNYLLTQPPARDPQGAYAGTYEIPGLFKLQENKGWGRRVGRTLAGGVPYNEMVLPDGTVVPYDAKQYRNNSGFFLNTIPTLFGYGQDAIDYANSLDSRAAAARQQLPAQSALLRALYGVGGK